MTKQGLVLQLWKDEVRLFSFTGKEINKQLIYYMMKKILFVTKYPLDIKYSLKPKFDGQILALKNIGYDVYVIAFDKNNTYLIHNDEIIKILKISYGEKNWYIHTKAFIDIFKTMIKCMNENVYDYVYMRSCFLDFIGYYALYKCHKKGTKIIIEIPTYPPDKEKRKNIAISIINKCSGLLWKRAASLCDLFTLIGEKSYSYLNRPAINIENGIQIEALPLRKYVIPSDNKTHYIALASMSYWHGYDRIIEGIRMMNPRPNNICFDFVGSGGDGSLEKWKRMVSDNSLDQYFNFYDYKTGNELDNLINNATLGICSLGLFRIKLSGSSSLKLREYTARGLPFVFAEDDPILTGKEEFCLKIENNNNPVDIQKIIDFGTKIQQNYNISNEMRKFAEVNMSWEKQFKKVFETIG